jgi:Fic family protein
MDPEFRADSILDSAQKAFQKLIYAQYSQEVLMERPDGYFTAREISEATGVSRRAVDDSLERNVTSGKVNKKLVKINRHVTSVYKPCPSTN